MLPTTATFSNDERFPVRFGPKMNWFKESNVFNKKKFLLDWLCHEG
jgi:hypothetical protein